MLREYLSNIANAIRSKLGTTETINAQDFADKVNKVYDKGRSDEWSDFWDTLQSNGTATRYDAAFGIMWNDKVFYPKYDIKPVNASGLFQSFGYSNSIVMDLAERLDECGVVLDTSNVTNANNMFSYAAISHVGTLDLRKVNTFITSFHSSSVKKIDKFITKDDGSQTVGAFFSGGTYITHIRIEGKLGRNISFQSCKLDVPSMKDVIAHLINYAGTPNEGTYKLTLSSTCWETLEASGKPIDDGLTTDETLTWRDYVGSLGWLY